MGWDGSDWQKLPVKSASYPNLRTEIFDDDTGADIVPYGYDGLSNDIDEFISGCLKYGFNRVSWDRWRNNIEATVLSSAARTASGNSADQTNHNARGILIIIDVTAVSGTSPTLQIRVQAKCPVSGKYYTIAQTATWSTIGTRAMAVYPGASDSQALMDNNEVPLPRTYRVRYIIGGTNPSFTFSVGAMYIV